MPLPLLLWVVGVAGVMLWACLSLSVEDWRFHRATSGRVDDVCPVCGRARGYRMNRMMGKAVSHDDEG